MFKLFCPSKGRVNEVEKFCSINMMHTHWAQSQAMPSLSSLQLWKVCGGGKKAVVVHHCAVLLVSWQGPTVPPGMTWISIIYWNKPSYYLAFSSMQSCPLHIVQITGHRLNFRLQFPISTTLFPLHWTHNSCFDLWLSSQVSHVYFSQAFL